MGEVGAMAKAQPIVGRKVRVGVIGAGRWATIAHLPGWVRDPRCEVVAVCDTDINLAETARQTFGAQHVTFDYRELVERDDLDVIKGAWSTTLDPAAYPPEERRLNARVVIDACRPWLRRDTFPKVARNTPDLDARLRAKWEKVLRGY